MGSHPNLLVVGEILKPWGYRGEVKLKILSDFPHHLTTLKTVYVGNDACAVQVERARLHSGFAILKLAGMDTPEAVGKLRGQVVRVPTQDAAPLRPGQYYHHQIIGLKVVTNEDETLGLVEEILETGANDVYLVRQEDGAELLLPAIEDVIQTIDLEAGHIVVRLIPGLL